MISSFRFELVRRVEVCGHGGKCRTSSYTLIENQITHQEGRMAEEISYAGAGQNVFGLVRAVCDAGHTFSATTFTSRRCDTCRIKNSK